MIFRFFFISALFCISSCVSGIPIVKTGSPQISTVSYGKPYRVQDKIYHPLLRVGNFSQEGVASWYGPKFHGKLTSNKEVYDMHSMTAAHKTLPFNTKVRVTNLQNNHEAVVRINDRGPFIGNRIIDMSFAAAKKLEMIRDGTARVRLTVLNPSSPRKNFSTPSNYSVQIGIYQELANASQLIQSIANSRAEPVIRNGIQFFKVLVGRFPNYINASKKLDWLKGKGFPEAFIVMEEN
tara:strand:+ start:151 stop:861 length:711 start_codon:yes stop_codon:yes gene_type:complete